MRILIATGNPGKAREFRQMLGSDRFQWTDLSAFPNAPRVEETGHTFRANACLKASANARSTGIWTLADDSGLEVDALGRKPGVHSARWAAMHQAGEGDAANNRLLLRQVASISAERRTARFVCVLALADPQGRIILTARDTIEGRMIDQERGSNGFGYDPLFYVPELACTTAELPSDRKNELSHRGRALRRLREMIDRWICPPAADEGAVSAAQTTERKVT